MVYQYQTEGVCATMIAVELTGNIIKTVAFSGGCDGNAKAIAKLVQGLTIEKVEELLRGNTCGENPTSCADQLTLAVRKAYEANKNDKNPV